jgi:hypothetical protein
MSAMNVTNNRQPRHSSSIAPHAQPAFNQSRGPRLEHSQSSQALAYATPIITIGRVFLWRGRADLH